MRWQLVPAGLCPPQMFASPITYFYLNTFLDPVWLDKWPLDVFEAGVVYVAGDVLPAEGGDVAFRKRAAPSG